MQHSLVHDEDYNFTTSLFYPICSVKKRKERLLHGDLKAQFSLKCTLSSFKLK